jgi:lysophospholipase L1-like esterase
VSTDRSVSLAVLGDSIAFGQGAAAPTDSLGPRLGAALRAAGTPAHVHVVAISGARSTSLGGQVRSALTVRPDVALIVIGANDVTHLVPAAQAAEQLGDAVRTLRSQDVEVVVVPAPDLSSVPLVPVQFRALARAASAALRAAQARAAIRAGARVAAVDVLHEAFAADFTLFSGDRFHPSSKGYALIAQALLPAVSAAVTDALSARGRSA